VHIRGTFQQVGLADLARFIAPAPMPGVLKAFAYPSGLVCFVGGRLDVAFSFESKGVEASGLPPFDLEQLNRPPRNRQPSLDAYRPGQTSLAQQASTQNSPAAEARAPHHSLSTVVPEQSPGETTEPARAQRSRGGALARLIGAARPQQGDQ
jgi:hypothetical protein